MLRLRQMHCNTSRKNLISLIVAAGAGLGIFCPTAVAETRHFSFAIEDTIITLVDKQTFHTFSFNGQTPGPLIHVREGDDSLARNVPARHLAERRRSGHDAGG